MFDLIEKNALWFWLLLLTRFFFAFVVVKLVGVVSFVCLSVFLYVEHDK